jgi:hypothetical protein
VTLEELQQRLTYWQGVLRIQDWRITLRWATWHELGPKADAHVEPSHYQKEALITLLCQEHYDADDWGVRQVWDPERMLLHELLHLVMAAWQPAYDSPEDLALEQAINHLAGALLDLDRRAQKLLEGAQQSG